MASVDEGFTARVETLLRGLNFRVHLLDPGRTKLIETLRKAVEQPEPVDQKFTNNPTILRFIYAERAALHGTLSPEHVIEALIAASTVGISHSIGIWSYTCKLCGCVGDTITEAMRLQDAPIRHDAGCPVPDALKVLGR